MTERSSATRLAELAQIIHTSYGYWGADNLEEAVHSALVVPAPPGDYPMIGFISSAVEKAASDVDRALLVASRLRRINLPQAWSGDAKVSAVGALAALERQLKRVEETFNKVARILAQHSGDLLDIKHRDETGTQILSVARDKLRGHTGWVAGYSYDGEAVAAAHTLAIEGADKRRDGAVRAAGRAELTASRLRDLACAARLYHLAASNLDPLTELVIADGGGFGPADELILTSRMADRAAEMIGKLNAEDRRKLDELLSRAKSPEEQAYILKALGAGYDMTTVSRFADVIRDRDGVWLREHLNPVDVTDSSGDPPGLLSDTKSHNAKWEQGNLPTCVASSNVMARAYVDPVYALQLTSGGDPDNPRLENPEAFAQRLRDEQLRVYDGGRTWQPFFIPGMSAGQSEAIANEHLTPHTGALYESHDLDTIEQRREALRKAEIAVDQGLPVPFSVGQAGRRAPHEMLIIGHDGDRIQIYNPWGYTGWVSRDDFIHGRMNALEPRVPSTPEDIRLPK